MTRHPITPRRFDEITGASRVHAREDRLIWTLPAIGKRLGRGRDFASALAIMPGTPIRRQGRQYFVVESELLDYMRASGLKATGGRR